jgi:phage terminase large subunit
MEDDPIHTRLVIEGRPNTLILNVNYDIAIKYGFLPDVILNEIEDDKKNRPALYKHKWLGEPSTTERKVYRDWRIIDEIPHEARLERTGVDFGYTNDPTAIVDIYYYNGGYIFDQVAYQKGLSNKQIADILMSKEVKATAVADSAEPKSIDELVSYGVNVVPASKGQGSVLQGIQFVQGQKCSITKRSVSIIKEYRNYVWTTDKNGIITNDPDHLYSHSMDAIRYAMANLYSLTRNDEEERAERLRSRMFNLPNQAK